MNSKPQLQSWRFAKALGQSLMEDHVLTGAAALSYYLLFSLFPGLIFLLTLLPYLPIENLHQTVMGFVSQALPISASHTVEMVVAEITLHKRSGLLSFGILLALWSASSAISAMMEEVNVTFSVKDQRSYFKSKLVAIVMALYLTVTFILSGVLLVAGGWVQNWLNTSGASHLGLSSGGHDVWQLVLTSIFEIFKWAVLIALLLSAFAVVFHFSLDGSVREDRKHPRWLSPGSVTGVGLLLLASFAFRTYVAHVSDYTASYGSLGAVIILMLWLYIAGLVFLVGSEINALLWKKRELWQPAGEAGIEGLDESSRPLARGRQAPRLSSGRTEFTWSSK